MANDPMNYYQAEKIRKTNFRQRMLDKQIGGQGMIGASLAAAGEGLRARTKMMGKIIDPMWLTKSIPFIGKNLSLAYGNIAGRSQADLSYFAGKKPPKTATVIPKEVTEGKLTGESASATLGDILSFMKSSREEDKRIREVKHNFEEEKLTEEERRHKELLGAINNLSGVKTATQITPTKKVDGSVGLFAEIIGVVKSMLAAVVASLEGMVKMAIAGVEMLTKGLLKAAFSSLDWILGLKKYILPLIDFIKSPLFRGIFMNPAFLGVASLAALLALGMKEKEDIEKNFRDEKYNDNPYAMQLRGEAETVGQAAAINQAKATKQIPRNQIVELLGNKNRTDAEISDYTGGADRASLEKWLKDNPTSMMFQGGVAAIANKPETAIPAGGKQSGVPSQPEEAATTFDTILNKISPSADWTDKIIPQVPNTGAMLEDMTNKFKELQMEEDSAPEPSTIVSMNNNSTKESVAPFSSTATQRDDTSILNAVLNGYKTYTV